MVGGADNQLDTLTALSEADVAVSSKQERLKALDEERERLKRSVEVCAERSKLAESLAEKVETRVRTAHRAVEAGREVLRHLDARSASVKNMQQHFAVKTETDTARRNLQAAEDDQLQAMMDQDDARAAAAGAAQALADAKKALRKHGAEIRAETEEASAELKVIQRQREALNERLQPATRALYRSVRGRRGGPVLVALLPDGACGRCYTSVPRQRQADIRSGSTLYLCEGCGVILRPAPAG